MTIRENLLAKIQEFSVLKVGKGRHFKFINTILIRIH